jgi:hypothetical protein
MELSNETLEQIVLLKQNDIPTRWIRCMAAEILRLSKELEDIKSRSCETCIWNITNGGECLRALKTEESDFDIYYDNIDHCSYFCSKYEKEPT